LASLSSDMVVPFVLGLEFGACFHCFRDLVVDMQNPKSRCLLRSRLERAACRVVGLLKGLLPGMGPYWILQGDLTALSSWLCHLYFADSTHNQCNDGWRSDGFLKDLLQLRIMNFLHFDAHGLLPSQGGSTQGVSTVILFSAHEI
jgi:hypothetical protein